MNKFAILFSIALLTFSTQLQAQITQTKTTKCYVGHFSYDKKYKLEKIDCSKLTGKKNDCTKEHQIRREQAILKMKAYQKKLKSLGYDVDITGRIDDKTGKVHNMYLKKLKRVEKRKQGAENKKAKSE